VTPAQTHDARCAALDAYLDDRRADGYSVETRTGVQAVIVRPHRLNLVMRWFGHGRARRRLVVSVDQDGAVTSVAAEPRRW
jgi:hypothetical protein